MTPCLPEILRLPSPMAQLDCHLTRKSSYHVLHTLRLHLWLALHQMAQSWCRVSVYPDRVSGLRRPFIFDFHPHW
jgi:hypothetical protein